MPGALLALPPVPGVLVRNGMPPIPTSLIQQPEARKTTSDSIFEKNFPQKLLDILETPEHSDILKWLPGGEAFIIVDKTRFASEDLPDLLKETQFTSFIRKLCRWKFIRIPRRGPFTGNHVYYHELFRRDQPALCKLMSCNGNITSSLNVEIAQERQRSLDSMSTTSILSPVVLRPKEIMRELYLNQQNSLRILEEANRVIMIEEWPLNIRFERDRLYDERQKRIVRQVEVPSFYRMEDAPSRAASSPAVVQDFKSRTSSTTLSQLTTEPFAALNVNQYVKQAIKESTVGYEFMTKVQAQTLPTTLIKTNVIAKAKTGTGKTISFLIPAIEAALANKNKKATTPLILSPTRELANA
jgi:antitoxin component of MazEF toxin-antitoxin module